MAQEVRMVDLHAQYEEIKTELWAEWGKALESMQLMLGPNMKAFEKEFASWCGAGHGVAVDSGTGALILALRALGIGPGDGVIVPPWTFFATPEAVRLVGARPFFVDVEPGSMNLDPEKVREFAETGCRFDGETLVEKRTGARVRAVIPVHIFGLPADMEAIGALASRYRLGVLEDCAQAHGAAIGRRRVGTFGELAAFSFYFSKNLSALGEAGLVLARGAETAAALERLRVHGQSDKYTHAELGYNARLDELQAVVLRLKLKRLEEWNRRRAAAADAYDRELAGLPLALPPRRPGVTPAWHLYVVRGPRRDDLSARLRERGIASAVHYPVPCHLQPALADLGYKPGSLPVSEKLAGEVLSLPMHPHLDEGAVAVVGAAVRAFYA